MTPVEWLSKNVASICSLSTQLRLWATTLSVTMKSDASEGRSSSRFSSSLAVLRALDAASDVFPLLKGVCGLVLHIADSIDVCGDMLSLAAN